MVMVLPFVTALIAAVFALRRSPGAAFGWALLTVLINLAWLFYHATSRLDIVL